MYPCSSDVFRLGAISRCVICRIHPPPSLPMSLCLTPSSPRPSSTSPPLASALMGSVATRIPPTPATADARAAPAVSDRWLLTRLLAWYCQVGRQWLYSQAGSDAATSGCVSLGHTSADGPQERDGTPVLSRVKSSFLAHLLLNPVPLGGGRMGALTWRTFGASHCFSVLLDQCALPWHFCSAACLIGGQAAA